MGAKILSFSREARAALLEGVRKLAGAVKVTLGPGGHHVAIGKAWGSPVVTRDGVTVAKEIELPDRIENAGAQLVREVAVKTGDVAGDGTTTATILAESIFAESIRHVEAGANPIVLHRGMTRAVDAVVKELEKRARPVKGKDEINQVASVAAGNDEEIGRIIAEAVDRVGKDGAVTVEEAKGMETSIERIEGMQFDKGYSSPHFINRPERMECVLEDALILVHEKKISSVQDLVPLLELVARAKKPLLVIADEVEAEALAVLVVNRLQGILPCCAVRAPGYGDRRKELLEDIAIFTGARPLLEDIGVPLKDVQLADLGRARKIVVEKEATTLIEGAGQDAAIQGRIGQLKKAIETVTSDYDKEKLQERLSKLSGGVAQINVGAATEMEMKEKRARIEDALHAARAAVEEGVLPGGGVALVRARAAVDTLKLSGDEATGAGIVRRALEEPLRQLADNAGARGSVVVKNVEESKDDAYGYDALTGEYGNLFKAGVLDPKKVVRLALQNAASVAGIFLTTEAVISEKEDPAAEMRPPGMGGAPGMGGMPGMM
jgi:chaperonin GroEL